MTVTWRPKQKLWRNFQNLWWSCVRNCDGSITIRHKLQTFVTDCDRAVTLFLFLFWSTHYWIFRGLFFEQLDFFHRLYVASPSSLLHFSAHPHHLLHNGSHQWASDNEKGCRRVVVWLIVSAHPHNCLIWGWGLIVWDYKRLPVELGGLSGVTVWMDRRAEWRGCSWRWLRRGWPCEKEKFVAKRGARPQCNFRWAGSVVSIFRRGVVTDSAYDVTVWATQDIVQIIAEFVVSVWFNLLLCKICVALNECGFWSL